MNLDYPIYGIQFETIGAKIFELLTCLDIDLNYCLILKERDIKKEIILEPLDYILDKTYAFRLKYRSHYKQGSVMQLSEDEDLIWKIIIKIISPQVELKGQKLPIAASQTNTRESVKSAFTL